jgi:hypothetical protein
MSVNVQSAILSLSEEHGGSLSVVVDSKQYTMRNDNPLFGQAVEAYRTEDWDSLMNFLSPEKAVREYLFECDDVKVENGAVYFGGSAVHSLCVDRILQFCDSGFSPMPLVRFLSKLQKNPSRRSVEELYRFLERNNLTVTTNGNFLAYKAVTSDFYSITAGMPSCSRARMMVRVVSSTALAKRFKFIATMLMMMPTVVVPSDSTQVLWSMHNPLAGIVRLWSSLRLTLRML